MNKNIVLSFVDAINNQDINTLISLMADDFIFIDTYGGRENKEDMKTGWQGYFDWFPDYCIHVEDYIANDEFAIMFPAAWKVVVSETQVVVWQVFCDSKKQLDSMT